MKRGIIVIVMMLAAAVFFGGCGMSALSFGAALKANWGITLPSAAGSEEVYSMESDASFHGDGIRYHVLSYKDEDSIEMMLKWDDEDGTAHSENCESWLDRIEVPADMRPVYEGSLSWYKKQTDNSEIVVLLDKEQERLYITESFL